VRRARELSFNVRLRTNAILIREKEAELLRELYLDSIQISLYSDRAEVHDGITKVPGSLKRSLAAARFLLSRGLKVTLAHVVMRQNFGDYARVRTLANELGAHFTVDPTVTPHLNGDRSILALNVGNNELKQLMQDETLTGSDDFCAAPAAATEAVLDGAPCSAGHSLCYISPYGDVYPCVQFPLPSGDVRRQAFIDIWRDSPQLKEVRSIRIRDLPTCSLCPHSGSCSRCPGLAYMEGNMRGPSSADCVKSYARTGVPTAAMRER
jgi:radical SAM protein with 4Fe4S-binding SPASM domain